MPWQGGMTGIWVDTSKAPDIHSVNDLFDPKYKGKVTMLDELRETVPLVMLARRRRPGARRAPTSGCTRSTNSRRRRQLRSDPPLHRQRVHRGPDRRQHRRRDRLVGRRLADRKPERRMADADRGLHDVVGKHGDPGGRAQHRRGAGLDGLRLPARGGGRHHRIRRIHLAGAGREGAARETGIGTGGKRDRLPDRRVHPQLHGPEHATGPGTGQRGLAGSDRLDESR